MLCPLDFSSKNYHGFYWILLDFIFRISSYSHSPRSSLASSLALFTHNLRLVIDLHCISSDMTFWLLSWLPPLWSEPSTDTTNAPFYGSGDEGPFYALTDWLTTRVPGEHPGTGTSRQSRVSDVYWILYFIKTIDVVILDFISLDFIGLYPL